MKNVQCGNRRRPEINPKVSCGGGEGVSSAAPFPGGGMFQGDLKTPESQPSPLTVNISYLTGMQDFFSILLSSPSPVR